MYARVQPRYGPPSTQRLRDFVENALNRTEHEDGQIEAIERKQETVAKVIATLVDELAGMGLIDCDMLDRVLNGTYADNVAEIVAKKPEN